MHTLLSFLRSDTDFQAMLDGVARGLSDQLITGLSGSARHLFVAGMQELTKRTLLIITSNTQQAQHIVEDLTELLPDGEVYLFPEREMAFFDMMAYSPDQAMARHFVLEALSQKRASIVVVPIAALSQPLLPVDEFQKAALSLAVGSEIPLEQLLQRLLLLGYERVERVENKGEFAVRGGIVDIAPLTLEQGVRIEFFDVEVDSIRSFDLTTQRSLDKLGNFTFWPIREVLLNPERMRWAADQIDQMLTDYTGTIRDPERLEKFKESIGADVERMREGIFFPNILRYINQIYPQVPTLMSYLPKDTVVVFDEPTRIRETIRQLEKDDAEEQTQSLERGESLPGLFVPVDRTSIFTERMRTKVHFSLFMRGVPGLNPQNTINVTARAMQNFHGQMATLKNELDRWLRGGYQVIFLAADADRANRLGRVLQDYGMQADRVNDVFLIGKRPVILEANLGTGFELVSRKLAVITETEVFSNKKKARRQKAMTDAEKIKNYQDLRIGDYVVHVNHGIGRYMGVETLTVDGIHRDFLHLKYAGKDKLFVPVEQLDLVQKYVGAEEKEPKLFALGGSEWARAKAKVQKAVQDMAEDLIKLYAERQATPGHPFSADSQWQWDFEAMFPYDETPDQVKAINEIKRDMESPRPMDRLLCGDVGYGKTEVAIRAAFKAVMDGKQVAVLVPTTILAQQHFETFKERFSGFPVRVEVISRFRTQAQMKEVVKGVREGTVDVVIGTHRLLNKDMKFKDLGLLVIDEEQRFGVKHKEKLKQIRANVDCLTLTATPIPRTLHMSMLGVRDLSVIETPPENRFPVQTYVVEYNDGLIIDAIERELARGGQVYFLYNKVKSIDNMAGHIRALVPEARVLVGHGQMGEEELERVMIDFLEGEADVLVSTTIIETGLDIPNVNTLIVYDADHMGLSQLYQLRGRVGRSNRIAYAYFTYQRDKALTEVAEKRLQAIKEFTELGSGFKIAMRDLAIRGAGNLLGAQQHGNIASVGFDLYSDMLTEAVRELKGEKKEEVHETAVELVVDAYIPSTYIPDEMQKIEMYKKFVAAKNQTEINDLEEEVEDRFGEIPREVLNLLAITRIKALATRYGFVSITQERFDVTLKLHEKENGRVQGDKLFAMTQHFPDRLKLMAGNNISITLRVKGWTTEQTLEGLLKLLEMYPSVLKQDLEISV